MLDFESANAGIVIEPWCLEELRVVFRRLSDDDLASWFGPALNDQVRARSPLLSPTCAVESQPSIVGALLAIFRAAELTSNVGARHTDNAYAE